MKITLVALNASYTHTSLACASLKTYCRDPRWSMDTMEFTINDHYGSILSRLFAAESDVYGFSCYIWNIDLLLKLCRDLKLIRPHSFIVLGGPEVSYDAEQIMIRHAHLDAIICGEGELTMYDLLQTLAQGQALEEIPGMLIRRQNELIIGRPRAPLKDLDTLPSSVPFMNTEGRLVYYETSRGCPFSCTYCLSACDTGVRFFSLERVKSDLQALMKSGAKVIKFVDRSFSINEKRARQIMEFILAHNTSTRFHFEINAELLSDEMLDFLAKVPQDRFDFEIGIQSTYPPTLEAIHRNTEWSHLRERILRLQKVGNIHLHVDLIAGLPFESYQQFSHSFNEVYNLQADMIQLGFLKMLKGSPLCEQAGDYQYVFQPHPPYEVLSNHVISFAELDRLHLIEDMLGRFCNSHHFERTIKHLVSQIYHDNAFRCFEALAQAWHKNRYHLRQHNREAEYVFLLRFVEQYHPGEFHWLRELLKCDYLGSFPTGHLPDSLESFNPDDNSDQLYTYLKDDEFIRNHFPQLVQLSHRQRRRQVHMEWLKLDIEDERYLSFARPTFFIYNTARNQLEEIFQI